MENQIQVRVIGMYMAVVSTAFAAMQVQAEALRLRLNNGDCLTVELIAESADSWQVRHPALGELAIAKSQAAPLAPATQESLTPKPANAPAATTAASSKANAVEHKLTLGLNGHIAKRHNQNWQLGWDASHKLDRSNWKLDTAWFYSTADGEKTDNEAHANFNYDWYFSEAKRRFIFARLETHYDEPTAWELRNSVFGGLGYDVVQSDRGKLQIRGGAGGSYEHGSVQEWKPEAVFASSTSQWQLTEYQSLVGEVAYYPSLEDVDVYRMNLKLEWRSKLPDVKGLSLRFGIRDTYDSVNRTVNPNDFKYFAGLAYDL